MLVGATFCNNAVPIKTIDSKFSESSSIMGVLFLGEKKHVTVA